MAAPKNPARTKLGSPRVGIPGGKRGTVAEVATGVGSDGVAETETKTLTDAKHRNEGLKGRLLAIEVAVKEGRLVDRATEDKRIFALMRTTRDAIRSIPRRAAAEVHAADDVPSVQRILARELDEALRVLCERLNTLEAANVQ